MRGRWAATAAGMGGARCTVVPGDTKNSPPSTIPRRSYTLLFSAARTAPGRPTHASEIARAWSRVVLIHVPATRRSASVNCSAESSPKYVVAVDWLSFESSKEEFAEWAYPITVDKDAYSSLESRFNYKNYQDDLDKFLKTKQ